MDATYESLLERIWHLKMEIAERQEFMKTTTILSLYAIHHNARDRLKKELQELENKLEDLT